MTSRRGSRSPATPPSTSVETCASVQAAKVRPTSVAECVSPRTANATAIGARFVPKNDTVRAANSSRNSRCLKTLGGFEALVPVAPEPRVRLPERPCLLIPVRIIALRGFEVTPCFGNPLVLALLPRTRGPSVEPLPDLGEVLADVGDEAEVDQCERRRVQRLDRVERRVPRLDV